MAQSIIYSNSSRVSGRANIDEIILENSVKNFPSIVGINKANNKAI